MRREVLLGGKYLAGLLAASLIFTAGRAAVLRRHALAAAAGRSCRPSGSEHGLAHALCYAAAAVLACVGYGSVFLAAGLLVRNPIVPAAVLLLWEGVNRFLPSMLQKLSVLYYVQALCPVPPPLDPDMPALAAALLLARQPALAAAGGRPACWP